MAASLNTTYHNLVPLVLQPPHTLRNPQVCMMGGNGKVWNGLNWQTYVFAKDSASGIYLMAI